MTTFDKMKIEFLTRLKDAEKTVLGEVHFLVGELAGKYSLQESYVRQKLVEWHRDRLICLSGYHQSDGAIRPLEEWRNSESFFNYPLDGNRKRAHLLAGGAEFLELVSADEAETPKRAIGFHG